MKKRKSTNLKVSNSAERKALMEGIHTGQFPDILSFLESSHSEVISPKTILNYINEELNHDKVDILNQSGQFLNTMSSGERKKAYFEFVVSLNPEVLVLDHFLDNLDSLARNSYLDKLEKFNQTGSLLNIYSRSEDRLNFITNNIKLSTEASNKLKTSDKSQKNGVLPPPPKEFVPFIGRLISFENVKTSYLDKPILKEITWEVNSGDFWHLYGPNGSGKTTLLTMIAGDNPKAYGQNIQLFGRQKGSGETIWEIKRKVGYFTSNMTFNFARRQSVRDMITSGFYDSIGLYTKAGDHQIMLANQWIEFLGLGKMANQPFVDQSLCHQRMVMIARAMVKHPPVLILDEPSVDLDETNAHMMTDLINKIAKEGTTTIIYVSHRIESGLSPTHQYQLIPSDQGSTGIATTC